MPVDPAPVYERLADIQQDSGTAGLTTQTATPEPFSNHFPASQIAERFLECRVVGDIWSAQQVIRQAREPNASQKPHITGSHGAIDATFGIREERDEEKDLPIITNRIPTLEEPDTGRPPSEAEAERRANDPTSMGVSYKDFCRSKPSNSSLKVSAPLRTLSELTNRKHLVATDVERAKERASPKSTQQFPCGDNSSSHATHGQGEVDELKRCMLSSATTEDSAIERKTTITIIEPYQSKEDSSSEVAKSPGGLKIDALRDPFWPTEDLQPRDGPMSSPSSYFMGQINRSQCSEGEGDTENVSLKCESRDARSLKPLPGEVLSTTTKRRWFKKDPSQPPSPSQSTDASEDSLQPEMPPQPQGFQYDNIFRRSKPYSFIPVKHATDPTLQTALGWIGPSDIPPAVPPEIINSRLVIKSPDSTESATDSSPAKKTRTFSLPFDKRARSLFRRLNSDEGTSRLKKHHSHFGNLAAMRRDRPSIEQQIRNRTQRTAERVRRRFSSSAEASVSRAPLVGVNANSRTGNVEIRVPTPQQVDSEHRRLLSPAFGSRFGEHVSTIAHQGMNVESHGSSERSSGTETTTQGDLYTESHGEADSAHSVAPPPTLKGQNFEAEKEQDIWRLNEERMQRINKSHPVPFSDIPPPPFAPRAFPKNAPRGDFLLPAHAAGLSTFRRINVNSSHDTERTHHLPGGIATNDHHPFNRSRSLRRSSLPAGRKTNDRSPSSRGLPPLTPDPTDTCGPVSAACRKKGKSSVSAAVTIAAGPSNRLGRSPDWTTPGLPHRQGDTRALPAALAEAGFLPKSNTIPPTEVESSVDRGLSTSSDEPFPNISGLALQAELSASPTSPISPNTVPESSAAALHTDRFQNPGEICVPDVFQSDQQLGSFMSSVSPISPRTTVFPSRASSRTTVEGGREANERGYFQVSESPLDIHRALQYTDDLDDGAQSSEIPRSAQFSSESTSVPSLNKLHPIHEATQPPSLPPNVDELTQVLPFPSSRLDGATTQFCPSEVANAYDGPRRDTAHQSRSELVHGGPRKRGSDDNEEDDRKRGRSPPKKGKTGGGNDMPGDGARNEDDPRRGSGAAPQV